MTDASGHDETWQPIPGYEGLYDVSDQGRVRSWRDSHRRQTTSPHTLVAFPDSKGYPAVRLSTDGRRVAWRIHRLVLLSFTGPCPSGLEVRHLNGHKTDNRLCNLIYGTASENQLDNVAHGRNWNARKDSCKHGHAFTDDNTLVRRNRRGRDCRTCARARYLAFRERASA